MAGTWFDKINKIYAANGFVYIDTVDGDVVIPIDEAIDRAVAIQGMIAEEHMKEVANQLMASAWEAKMQVERMHKEEQGSFDMVKEQNLRKLIAYGQQRMLRKR